MALSLHGLFEDAAEKYPNHIAVVFDDGQAIQKKTYSQVHQDTKVICDILKNSGVKDGIVGLACSPCIILPSLILGVLTVPAAFHPINLDSGHYGVEAIVKLQISFILIDVDRLQKTVDFFGVSRLALIENFFLLANGVLLVKLNTCTAVDKDTADKLYDPKRHGLLAYCITTSGTTGSPKVIQVPHTCILPNILHLREIFKITDMDLLYLASSLTFDPSIVELFLALVSGAAILITPNLFKIVPKKFVTMTTRRHRVTVLQLTPTLLCNLGSDMIKSSILYKDSHVRVLAFGGENCPSPSMLGIWLSPGNTTALFNLYGTTEVSCWATCHQITSDNNINPTEDMVPLGRPLSGTELEIRDKDGCVIKEGEGQLFIGGCSRVCAVLGERVNEESAGRVMRDTGDIVRCDSNGRLLYLGRKDQQTKRHGMRLNCLTLEEVVNRIVNVSSSAAVMMKGRLLLFVCEGWEHVKVSDIEDHIVRSLPVQYHPDYITVRNTMPTTKHGKVDKRELCGLFETESAFPSDLTKVWKPEEILKLKWKEVLSLDDSVDTERMFLEYGGDSFKAVRLAATLEASLGRSFPHLLDKILHDTYLTVQDYLCAQMNAEESLEDRGSPSASQKTTTGVIRHDWADYQVDSIRERSKEIKAMEVSTTGLPLPEIHVPVSPLPEIPVSPGVISEKSDEIDTNSEPQVFLTDFTTKHTPLPGPVKVVSSKSREKVSIEKLGLTVLKSSSSNFIPTILIAKNTPGDKLKSRKRSSNNDFCSSSNKKVTRVSDISDMEIVLSVSRGSKVQYYTPAFKTHLSFNNKLTGSDFASLNPGEIQIEASSLSCSNRSSSTHLSLASSESESHHTLTTDTDDSCVGENVINLSEKWRYNTGKCVDSSPLLAVFRGREEGLVIVGSHSHCLSAVSMTTGHLVWEVKLGDRVESSPCLTACGQFVVVGCYDHYVYTLNILDGSTHFKFQTGREVKSSPTCDSQSNLIFIGSHDHNLYALDVKKRHCLWKNDLDGSSIFSSPTLTQRPYHVIAATLTGNVIALHPLSGEKVWSSRCMKPVFSSPLDSGCGVCVGSVDGQIYFINYSGQLTLAVEYVWALWMVKYTSSTTLDSW